MVRKYLILLLIISFLSCNVVSAWEFNGTTYDENGNNLSNVNISIAAIYMPGGQAPSTVFTNITASNATGRFSINVSDNSSLMYQISMSHTNASTGKIDFVGKTLPAFPYRELAYGINTNFYLKSAGTINISVINASGNIVPFHYQVMDTSLGSIVASNWSGNAWPTLASVNVPIDKNYSIMVYPNNSMPLSFNWNNFSTGQSYNLTNISNYNATTKVLNKTFNISMTLRRYTGIILNESGFAIENNELIMIPYLLQPGNMIFMSDSGYGSMPYNMSAWLGGTNGDSYLTNGSYNITLPGPAENQSIILFVSGRNGSNYYGSYKNITLSYGTGVVNTNINVYNMLGNTTSNLTMTYSNGSSGKKVETKNQVFGFVNASTNQTINMSMEAHIKVDVDYSNFNGTSFTFMVNPARASTNFSVPLLNTSVKEISIFTQDFAPKRISSKTASEILDNSNISLSTFNPRALDGTSGSGINIALYMSNTTCNIPNPPASCIIGSSGNMGSFNPLSSVMGGGKLNFMMGLGSVQVYYINVDLIASGPPDALFDSNNGVTERTSGGFGKLMRFGSQGPKIYDYVIVSMPYTEGSTSVAGLNENADVNLSVPALYDENWNVLWNATLNGTNGTLLAGNYSYYNARATEWETLMGNNNCTKDISLFNATYPCFINTSNNTLWIRIPHFSGTGPSISAAATTVSTTTTEDDSSPSGGSIGVTTTAAFWSLTYVYSETDTKNGFIKELKAKERVKVIVDKVEHFVGVISMTADSAVINVSSTPQQATLKIGEEKKFDVNADGYYDLSVGLITISATNNINRASISTKGIYEKIEASLTNSVNNSISNVTTDASDSGVKGSRVFTWFIVGIVIMVVIIIGIIIVILSSANKHKHKYIVYKRN